MMVTDESLLMFSQLGGLLCQLAAAASQVGVLTRTAASGPETSGREEPSLGPVSVISPSAVSLCRGCSDLRLHADKTAS